MKRGAFRVLARNADSTLVAAATRAASSLLNATQNDDSDPRHDGEFAVLDRIATFRPRVVIDVGAHTGAWTTAALQRFPGAVSHACEPAPPTFTILQSTVQDLPGALAHQIALSERSGTANLGYDSAHPEMATLSAVESHGKRFDVRCQTGDDFLAQHSIQHVDFLKVDVEGHDLSVLKGFRGALSAGVIDVVQFEFGPWNAITRSWLHDFYAELDPDAYAIGRIWPKRVQFADYDYRLEAFSHRQNFVAVRRDLPHLVDALR